MSAFENVWIIIVFLIMRINQNSSTDGISMCVHIIHISCDVSSINIDAHQLHHIASPKKVTVCNVTVFSSIHSFYSLGLVTVHSWEQWNILFNSLTLLLFFLIDRFLISVRNIVMIYHHCEFTSLHLEFVSALNFAT